MGRGIKTRQNAKAVKVLDRSLTVMRRARQAYVKTKEKAKETQPQAQAHASPVDYAQEKISQKGEQAVNGSVYLAKRAVKMVLDKRKKQAPPGSGKSPRGIAAGSGTEKKATAAGGQKSRMVKTAGREQRTVKTAGNVKRTVKEKGRAAIKQAARGTKTAGCTVNRAANASRQAARTAQTAKTAVRTAQRAAAVRRAAAQAARTARITAKAVAAAVKAAIAATKALITMIAAGGWIVVLVLIIVVLFGAVLCSVGGGNSSTVTPVSAEVEAYGPVIQKYAQEYGIPEYVELIKAVMMQESGGRGADPMQSSEGPFNTEYPKTPNGITDPEYSIRCGVQEVKSCLAQAGVESPVDMEHIKLALQGYNFGNGYISWARENYGGYTLANAAEFSDMMAQRLGWNGYGDKQYVPHVLRYYVFGRVPTGVGSQAIVQVALSQEGNIGGQPYWSWYGFSGRVEWCACFVSWCANQCGYIEAGVMPKFSSCAAGAAWFEEHGQLKDGSYVPSPGDIIFFDRGSNGSIDHVGIVVNVTDGVVNTIEGNTGDSCKQRSYPLGRADIYGYGVPAY